MFLKALISVPVIPEPLEIFVLIFFGPVAVGGTYYLQTLEINFTVILAGLSPGLISTALLTVNNLRDIHTDKKLEVTNA